MPLNPPALTAGFLAPNLASVAHIGTGMPQFAQGVSNGVVAYIAGALKVITTGAGVMGSGVTIIPLLVPPPLFQAALLSSFASMKIIGPMSPLTATGLANGIASGLASLALVTATWPNVGVGAGVAKFVGPSAIPFMVAGFASAAMTNTGSIQMATAIGIALDTVFQSFIMPVPIVGSPSIVPSAGVGFGVVV